MLKGLKSHFKRGFSRAKYYEGVRYIGLGSITAGAAGLFMGSYQGVNILGLSHNNLLCWVYYCRLWYMGLWFM